MPYTCTRRILLNDVDAAGVVFFARLVAIAHEAYELALADAGLSLAKLIHDRGHLLPLVHSESDFKHPLRHGEDVHITVRCARIGSSSYTIAIDLAIPGKGQSVLAASMKQIHACVDRDLGESVPLPPEIRSGLEKLSGGPEVRKSGNLVEPEANP
jgi:1,4-dihydroxy-2-naphthoyl-CoA hydrolase